MLTKTFTLDHGALLVLTEPVSLLSDTVTQCCSRLTLSASRGKKRAVQATVV